MFLYFASYLDCDCDRGVCFSQSWKRDHPNIYNILISCVNNVWCLFYFESLVETVYVFQGWFCEGGQSCMIHDAGDTVAYQILSIRLQVLIKGGGDETFVFRNDDSLRSAVALFLFFSALSKRVKTRNLVD